MEKGYWLRRGKSLHWRTCRWRARQLVTSDVCAWAHIGQCKGPIQVAHVDQDFTNNDILNLLALCASHHSLLDNDRIDPTDPKMPVFYVDASGKRRYRYSPLITKNQYPHRGYSRAEWVAISKTAYWDVAKTLAKGRS